jgi:hypothetical protein
MEKNRVYKTAVSVAVVGLSVLMFGGSAFAVPPPDPTGGAAADVQSQTTTWITGQGVPLIVALLVIGIVIGLLVKYARRGARAS